MNSKPYIILGEAHESESEEELDFSEVTKTEITQYKGRIVTGEAPESDEEIRASEFNVVTSSNTVAVSHAPPSVKKKHKSILVKKLCERNASLHRNINEFISQAAVNAGNELNATNQRLLKSQVQLQEGAEHLKKLNSNISFLTYNLQSLLSAPFLPNIKTVCEV